MLLCNLSIKGILLRQAKSHLTLMHSWIQMMEEGTRKYMWIASTDILKGDGRVLRKYPNRILILSSKNSSKNSYFTRIALTNPSWPGRFVILALPLAVIMIAPLVITLCLANCLSAGLSVTVFISSIECFFIAGS